MITTQLLICVICRHHRRGSSVKTSARFHLRSERPATRFSPSTGEDYPAHASSADAAPTHQKWTSSLSTLHQQSGFELARLSLFGNCPTSSCGNHRWKHVLSPKSNLTAPDQSSTSQTTTQIFRHPFDIDLMAFCAGTARF